MSSTATKNDDASVIRRRKPNNFGSLPGLTLYDRFENRHDLSRLKIHPPPETGMYASPSHEGVQSIVMSGGYDDDMDFGDTIFYTGVGGQNRSSIKQVADQSFKTPLNACLRRNIEEGYPVRLFRGFKLKSVYAPLNGYRYDGLYSVLKAKLVTGVHKTKICRFKLQRIVPPKGLPKIPTRRNEPGPVYIPRAQSSTLGKQGSLSRAHADVSAMDVSSTGISGSSSSRQ